MAPNAICFEITETAAINNLEQAAESIQRCKSLVMLFALDDFGTGVSSSVTCVPEPLLPAAAAPVAAADVQACVT